MKKGYLLGAVIAMGIFTQSFAFSDVSKDFWAYDKIEAMYTNGVISGFEDGTFRPNNTITREQVATVIAKFFNIELVEGEKKFEDVPEGHWSEKYVNNLVDFMPVGNIEGKLYFRPQDNATRLEVAETVAKIMKYDLEEVDQEIIEKFADKDVFEDNSKKYISAVAKNGIMVGDNKGQFRPNATVTRAEFCALMNNIYLSRNQADNTVNEDPLIVVNGEIVSVGDFNLHFNLQKMVYEDMFGSKEIWEQEMEGQSFYDIVKDASKDLMIDNMIKLQKANELGIKLTAEEENIIYQYINSIEGIEICNLYKIDTKDFYKMSLESEVIRKLARSMYDTMDHSTHSHLDINAPLEMTKYNVRHILLNFIQLSEDGKSEVKSEAEKILERAKNGEDFAELARIYSTDGGSNTNGGLYEDVSMGEFAKEFEEAALSLEPGEIYPILVETIYGYHIIKLEDKVIASRELTIDEKYQIIEKDFEELAKKWLSESTIEVKDIYKSI